MEYYIQNKSAGYLGNAIMFWAKNRRGYTADINKAERFSSEEAEKICRGNPDKNKAWPVDYINSCEGVQQIVDHQYLDFKQIQKFD